MIGSLSGRIAHRGPDHVLLDVAGVGYIVQVSDRTLAGLPPVGQPAALFTDLLVREDLLQLFGFPTLLEKEWHRLLMTVQGVGAKAALAIMGVLGADGIARAIALGDTDAIRGAPGVGPKIAQRVVLELKAKVPGLMAAGAGTLEPLEPGSDVIEPGPRALRPAASPEALSALVNLGYSPSDAAGAVAQSANAAPGADTAALIRAALKLLAPKV